jgi:hypothetical protein
MEKLLTMLGSFFNLPKIASISVPGILAAVAVAILMYPPPPVDMVPSVKFLIGELPSARTLEDAQKEGKAACETKEGPLTESGQSSILNQRDTARDNQRLLDTLQSQLAKCIEQENSMRGAEVTENSQLNADIEVRKNDQNDIQKVYQGYERSNSPLRDEYWKKYQAADARIRGVREKILKNEQRIRERDRRLAALTRESNVVAERLKDPGRLRPRRAFDEVLTALANHAFALAVLALIIGFLFNPINRAIIGIFYDFIFRQEL